MNKLSLIWNKLTYRLYGAKLGAGKPVPAGMLDREYATGQWDHFYGPEEAPRFDCLLELLEEREGSYSLLELGCGSGRLPSLLPWNRVARYLGVDLSSEGLKRARDQSPGAARFIQADFETWRPTEEWDVILFNESIGYARDPGKIAATFSQYLRPGGCLMISHHRYGNSAAQWQRIEKLLQVEKEATVKNKIGQVWDIKLLRSRA